MPSRQNYGAIANEDTEEGHEDARRTNRSKGRMQNRLLVDIDTRGADFILILLFFISGLVDGAVYNSWGSFVSMQTGNTVFVGLGLAATVKQIGQADKPYGWVKSLTAICCFQFGAFFFSRFHKIGATPVRRWVIMSSFVVQTLSIALAATLVSVGVIPTTSSPIGVVAFVDGGNEFTILSPSYAEKNINCMVLVPLAILSFQSAGQAVGSRALGYPGTESPGLPTGVLTSVYVALWSDPNILTAGLSANRERNQRLAAVFLLIVGAVFGGLCTDGSWLGVGGALWIAVALKAGTVLAWWLWAPEPFLKHGLDD